MTSFRPCLQNANLFFAIFFSASRKGFFAADFNGMPSLFWQTAWMCLTETCSQPSTFLFSCFAEWNGKASRWRRSLSSSVAPVMRSKVLQSASCCLALCGYTYSTMAGRNNRAGAAGAAGSTNAVSKPIKQARTYRSLQRDKTA